ncbi:hypothetical protein ACP4OV_016022 [Aristida adscensionis]
MADGDFDVSCFLQDPDAEEYMPPLSSDRDAPHADGGQNQQAPAEHAEAPPAAPPQMLNSAPETGFQFAPAVDAPAFGFEPRNVDVRQAPAPPPTMAAAQQPIIDAEQFQSLPPPAFNNNDEPPTTGVEEQHAPIVNAEQYQAPPAMNNYDALPTTGGEQHQLAPEAMDVDDEPPATTAVNTAADNQAPNELHQGPGGDVTVWHEHEDPEAPLGSPSLYDHAFLLDDEPDATDTEKSIEDGIAALGGTMAGLDMYPAVEEEPHFVPYVHGQLDCSRCCTVREVVHQGEKHKTDFIIHAAYPGVFQHVIINRFYIGPDGNQNVELQYIDLRRRTQEWTCDFVWKSVQSMQNDKSGQLQDSLATSAEQAGTNISEPALNNGDAHVELEIQMLKTILYTPAAHAGASSAPETSLPVCQAQAPALKDKETSTPVTQAPCIAEAAVPPEAASLTAPKGKESTSNGDPLEAPIDWTTFRPVILESSLVGLEAEVESSSALLYPSMLEKRQTKRESCRLSMVDARKYLKDMKEEAAKEPDLSAPPFRLLSRRLKHYRMHISRMNDIKKKIRKLEILVPRHEHDSAGLFLIVQKFEMFRREKRDLIAAIMQGLDEMVKQSGEKLQSE